LDEALALFRNLGDQRGVAWSLCRLGGVARNLGEYRRAATLLEQSLALSRESGDTLLMASSVSGLGGVARDQGDYSRATALFEESLALFGDLGDKEGTVLDMEELAAVACALEQPEPAARLFGAAHAVREAIGAPVPPVDQAAYERSVGVARARLGDDPFAAAWAQGRKATPEQVVADALRAMATTAPQVRSTATLRARQLRKPATSFRR
jgi:tetratricopeptide (TPR) repeat protein